MVETRAHDGSNYRVNSSYKSDTQVLVLQTALDNCSVIST